jgi:hypothetical protein
VTLPRMMLEQLATIGACKSHEDVVMHTRRRDAHVRPTLAFADGAIREAPPIRREVVVEIKPRDIYPQSTDQIGRCDYLRVGSVLGSVFGSVLESVLEPLPAAAARLGRRTALTLPLFPPPQKN